MKGVQKERRTRMNCDRWKQGEYTVWENVINMELYYALSEMIISGTKDLAANEVYRKIRNKFPHWRTQVRSEEYFSAYSLRYPGEVLERFEEKIGPERKHFRAVALALGSCINILEDDQIIGSQKQDFLRKLEQEAENDLYLSGAKYLLMQDGKEREGLLRQLSQWPFTNTEEVLFVLALYEDPKQGFMCMQQQLARFWSDKRSFLLFQNTGLLKWMLEEYAGEISACRKKDNAVLRTLVKLNSRYIRIDSQEAKKLQEAGYSVEEIAYGNSMLMHCSMNGGRIHKMDMTEERIAAQCCTVLLNSEMSLTQGMYSYLEWLLKEYRKYKIRYEQNEGIWEAIQGKIHPVQPEILCWLIQTAEKTAPYQVDVFDEKWDILTERLSVSQYQEVFADQIEALNNPSAEELKKYLCRYEKLTGRKFLSYFKEHRYERSRLFALFVEREIFIITDYIEKEPEKLNQNELDYIENYLCDLPGRKAFDFWQQFFEKHSIRKIRQYFGKNYRLHTQFMKCHYGRIENVVFRREFLEPDEEKQLLEWIEESVFLFEPDQYQSFVKVLIEDKQFQELYREEMPKLIREIGETKYFSEYVLRPLKQQFYEPEVFQKEEEERIKKEKEEKKQESEKRVEEMKKDIEESFDGSAASLRRKWRQYDCYHYSEEREKLIVMICGQLSSVIEQKTDKQDMKEMEIILELCSQMLSEKASAWKWVKPLLWRLGKEESVC